MLLILLYMNDPIWTLPTLTPVLFYCLPFIAHLFLKNTFFFNASGFTLSAHLVKVKDLLIVTSLRMQHLSWHLTLPLRER